MLMTMVGDVVERVKRELVLETMPRAALGVVVPMPSRELVLSQVKMFAPALVA